MPVPVPVAEPRASYPRERGRHRAQARPPRTRLDAYPRRVHRRWLLRLALAVPFVTVALLLTAGEVPHTPNALLLDRAAALRWDTVDVTWLEHFYPPISMLLAAALPSRVGLALIGAVTAAVLLQKVLEGMVQRRFPRSTRAIVLLAIAANPLFFYTALENLPLFLGLAFFGLGMSDLMRFVAWRNTQSGFRAGLLFMLAMLSAPSGLLFALVAVLAAPFLQLGRGGGRDVLGANVLVLVFPVLAALTSMTFLELIFLGRPLQFLLGSIAESAFTPEALWTFLTTTVSGWMVVAPVLCAWIIALLVRRPGAILLSTLTFAALLGAQLTGVIPPGTAGASFLLHVLTAVALIPAARTRTTTLLLDLVVVLLWVIAWIDGLHRRVVIEWTEALVALV